MCVLCLAMVLFGVVFVIVGELVMGVVVIDIVDVVVVGGGVSELAVASHSVVWFCAQLRVADDCGDVGVWTAGPRVHCIIDGGVVV